MTVRNLTDASGYSSGVVIDSRVTQDALSNWRDPSRPGGTKHRKKVGRITGSTGNAIEVERESDGPVLAMKRSNARGAKGPWCVRCFRQEGRQAG
jgi:hypothetical protein